jgi:hypothetical protein
MTGYEEALWVLRNKKLIEEQYKQMEEWKMEITERLPTGISMTGKVTGGGINDWTATQVIKLEKINKKQAESRFYLKCLAALETTKMPKLWKGILYRHLYDGISPEWTAKELKTTPGTVKQIGQWLIEAMVLLLEIYKE